MIFKNTKTKKEYMAPIDNEMLIKGVKNVVDGESVGKKKKINSKLLIVITFFTGVLLIISSYAWLSASLNVKVKFFDLVVSSDSGLFISLDGVEYFDSVEISMDSVITKLRSTYPKNTNQWAAAGLWPVSSNGIRNSNRNKFDTYAGEVSRRRDANKRRFLNTILINEDKPDAFNVYIAFDLFLKNVSGSPKSDNLYFDEATSVDFDDATDDDVVNSMSGVMNSMRFGVVKIGSVSSKEDVNTVQNITCNNNCEMVIYEPNSNFHSDESIEKVKENGVTLVDGRYNPTYAVTNEGENLQHVNGQEGTGIELDTKHFALQRTISNFDKPIYQIPNGITKFRAYVWIEGQDMDSLESTSKGAAINISLDFVKDLAGYE